MFKVLESSLICLKPCSSVSIAYFEQVNTGLAIPAYATNKNMLKFIKNGKKVTLPLSRHLTSGR